MKPHELKYMLDNLNGWRDQTHYYIIQKFIHEHWIPKSDISTIVDALLYLQGFDTHSDYGPLIITIEL